MGTEKERDALFDNARAVLIFLVVLGHLLADRKSDATYMKDIYYIIYMFHMPAFMFITGYFSKNVEKGRDNAVKSFLIPYLVFNTLFELMDLYMLGQLNTFFDVYSLTNPRWGMWFMLVCFFYKLLAKDFSKVRFTVLISFIAGLGLPLLPGLNTNFAIGRVFGFLFFFVAGLKCRSEWIAKLRRIPAWVGALVFAGCAVFAAYAGRTKLIRTETLFVRISYNEGAEFGEMKMRLFFYIAATVMTLAFIVLMTGKKCFLTQIGQNTLTVYALHLFIVYHIKEADLFVKQPYFYLPFTIAVSALLTWLLSRNVLKKVYDKLFAAINKLCFHD